MGMTQNTLVQVRARVLAALDRRGPLALRDLPAAWPLTRHQLRLVMLTLVEDGLVAPLEPAGSGPGLLNLTAAGRGALAA